MSKKSWIILGIAVAVIVGLMAIVHVLDLWISVLAFGSYLAGIASYWAVKKFGTPKITE